MLLRDTHRAHHQHRICILAEVKRYDPASNPPAEWLSLDEGIRIELVQAYHRHLRIDIPNLRLHTVIHVAVENQIAQGEKPVPDAIVRLQKEGLSRHDAVHAIGWVLADHLVDIMEGTGPRTSEQVNQRSFDAVEELSAEAWLNSG